VNERGVQFVREGGLCTVRVQSLPTQIIE